MLGGRWGATTALLLLVILLASRAAAAPPPAFAALGVEAALRAVRESITNWPEFAAANNLTGWGADPAIPPCLYTGVTCDPEGRLLSVSLQCPGCAVKAEGSLPEEVARLPTLATLNLQQNRLAGPLPWQYAAQGALPRLLNLIVTDNRLTGPIPEEWSSPDAFPSLSLLGLGGNALSGTLPPDLAMPSLLVARLHSCIFSGTLPAAWGSNASMPGVRVLSLQGNKLEGRLPDEWGEVGTMGHLEELYLQNNHLTGPLPPSWGSWEDDGLPALRVLNLSSNPIGGPLPFQWSQQRSFPVLRTLAVSNAGLQGSLPANWDCTDPTRCGLVSLQNLWLDGNNLSGPVPPNWATHPSLQSVFVRPGNPLLCQPPGVDFGFRLCDAHGGPDCRLEARLPACEPPLGSARLPAAEPAPSFGAAPAQAAASGGGGGGGGANTAAIVGGVIGGLAAAAGIVAALLLAARRHRRKQRKREMPFYADEGDKSGNRFPFPGAASTHPQPASRPSDESTTVDGFSPSPAAPAPLLHSPFAALAAELEPGSDGGSLDSGRSGRRRPGGLRSSRSASSLFGRVLGRGEASAQAEAADRALDAEIDRHISIEIGALHPARSAESALPGGTSRGTAGTGSKEGGSTVPQAWEETPPLFSGDLITPDEIQILKRPDGSDWELGAGGFGKVYKAVRHGAQPVAVKVLASSSEASRYQGRDDFVREIALLRACRDPNVVAFLGACVQPNSTILVTEYCDGGNLTRNLMAGRVNWWRRGKKIALDVARGLVYLHAKRIIHFDIKSPNVLLARDGTAKISDVGMAKIMAKEYSGVTGNVGTLAWAAPEMLLGSRCTEKADIYSYGVVLWEIVTAQTPIRGQLRDVRVPEECPVEVRELILDCLATNPRRRPSAMDIVERLRAIPDPPPSRSQAPPSPARLPPATPEAARRPPAPPAARPEARLQAAAGPAAGEPSQPQRRSDESDRSASSLGAAPGRVPPEAHPAYASPVPGSPAALMLAAGRGQAASGRPHRVGSIQFGGLPSAQPAPLVQPATGLGRPERASSSPPGASPLSAAIAAARAQERGPRRPPRPMQRQRSLDDPLRQMAEFQLVLQQTATQQQEAARSSAFHHPTAGRPEESRLLPPLEEQPHAGPPHAEQDAPGSADAPFASAHPALVRAMSGLQRSAQQGSGGVTTVAADLRRQPSAPVRVPAGPPLGQHGAAGPAGTASPRLPRVPSEPPPRLSESSAGTGTRSSSLTPAQLSAQQAQQQEDLAAEQEQAQQQLAADHAGQLEQLGARQRQQTAALSVRQQGEQLVLDMQQEEERQEQEQQDSLSEELRQLSQDSLTLQLQSQAPSQQQQQCVAEAGAPAQPGGQDSSRLNAVQLQGSQEAPGASYAHVRAFLARSAELATSPSFTSPFAQQPQPSLAAAAPAGSAQRAAPPVVASPFAQQAQQPSLERPPATPPPQQRISPPFVSPFAAAAPSPFAAAAAQESEPAPGPPPPPAV